ncbi:hypothetical protein BDY17DRAFT_298242 [Neohortaea acidophila]|uniref:Uncharacterized protein n=1 Tax=Neohortaea acidophila TaxID=245834 RepID=A0A6A6PQI9_9PEZI|nr:uncharacterized protein BDY17DRAFT_298242 [Neohortaea acidophila]KAF2482272.1 hypothetical protein BDY17DRAFT_298242 [Neohortaea acidophila]
MCGKSRIRMTKGGIVFHFCVLTVQLRWIFGSGLRDISPSLTSSRSPAGLAQSWPLADQLAKTRGFPSESSTTVLPLLACYL